MPGMQIFRRSDLAENVPYTVAVSNTIENIGWEIFSDAAQFGSAGRLRSAIYNSFGSIDVLDHELGHVWMVGIGQSLGLMNETYSPVIMGHWNKMADIQGQMGYYYIDDSGAIGHFAYNGDETWHLVPNTTVEPYSPLELYLMGLIPPEEVPDVHILENPDLSDPQRITAASYKTVTIEELMQSAGGERIPSYKDSQKEFNLAFIVTQDKPYNDAAYAFFSLLAHRISSVDEPKRYSSFAPFYWATGGQGRINTRILPELAAPEILPGDPTPPLAPTSTKEPTLAPAATDAPPAAEPSAPEEAATESILLPVIVGETEAVKEPAPKTWLWGGIIGAVVVVAAVWIWRSRKKRP
jgi:hypothetical protein